MNTKVLIAGAGPTGLMMACQLQRFGIDFVIIDKKEGTTDKSKALGVQSKTLEIYQQMGIDSISVEQGEKAKAANLIVESNRVGRIPLTDMGEGLSPFPFMLILEQNKNEKILNEYLIKGNNFVQWNKEIIDFNDNGSYVSATIIDKKGNKEEIKADYLIAADGAKSFIRHKLDIPFEGATYENIFYVADTEIEWELGGGEIFVCISKKTLNAFFPMKGNNRFRIIGILPKQFQSEEDITFEQIKDQVKKNIDIKIEFKNSNWFSIYRLHHRCVQNFRKGRVFMAGDAAHVHSPVGGQGMNTGLQDAYNLAWKLSMVIKNKLDKRILDTYNQERLPNAKLLVNTTDQIFQLGITKQPFIKFFRLNVFPIFVKKFSKMNFIRKFIYKVISQIKIDYFNSELSYGEVNQIKSGLRFPYFKINLDSGSEDIDIFELLKENKFVVFLFSEIAEKNRENFEEIEKFFSNKYSDLFVVKKISENNLDKIKNEGFPESFICIVRPDNYIGYISEDFSINRINNYLTNNLGVITS